MIDGMTPEMLLLGLGGAIAIVGIYYYSLEKSYRKAFFLVFKGNTFQLTKRRLIDDIIVPDNIVQIMLKGKGDAIENIKQFGDPFQFIKPKLMFFKDVIPIYLATKTGDTLFPMKVEDKELKFGELLAAKELTGMWISALRQAENDTSKKQPWAAGLIAILPVGVVMLLFAVILYIMLNAFIEASSQVVRVSERVLERANTLFDKMDSSGVDNYAKTQNYSMG